jgi:hypothetical protein
VVAAPRVPLVAQRFRDHRAGWLPAWLRCGGRRRRHLAGPAAGVVAEPRVSPAAQRFRDQRAGPAAGVVAEPRVPPAAQRFRDQRAGPAAGVIAEPRVPPAAQRFRDHRAAPARQPAWLRSGRCRWRLNAAAMTDAVTWSAQFMTVE